jgi:ubiquinone/menaquinone biosynthesis C-methylase UbiE
MHEDEVQLANGKEVMHNTMAAHKETIQAYNKIADDFNQRNQVSIYHDEFVTFASLLAPNPKILEIGCGTGRDGVELVKVAGEYIGIDASEAMLAVAKVKVPGRSFHVMDFYHLEFPDRSFDGFWAAAAFLHVPKAELHAVLSEAKRILRPGGVGFISVTEKMDLDEGIITESKGGGIDRYFAFYTQAELSDRLEASGFKVVQVVTQLEADNTKWLCFFVQKV